MNKQIRTGMIRAAAALLCAGGLMVSSAQAQQDAPPPPPDGQMQGPPPGGPGMRGGNPERRVEMLQKRLNLSNDQTAQVKSIFEGERGKMEAVQSNTALAEHDRRAQMMAIHQDSDAKIHGVLTPEQKTKYDEMEAHMRERMQDRRRGGVESQPDGSVPPPAPQQ